MYMNAALKILTNPMSNDRNINGPPRIIPLFTRNQIVPPGVNGYRQIRHLAARMKDPRTMENRNQ